MSSEDHLGWELGGGVTFPLERVRLTPAIRFRAFRRDFDTGGTPAPASIGYLVAELGLAFLF